MPDDEDYRDLAELLAHPETWTEADAGRARLLREMQARSAAAHDRRDASRVQAMVAVVQQLDDALVTYEGRVNSG
jgi:hypothetical protein